MNISPRLAAAAASTRTPEDVLRARPQFGTIARAKHDERQYFARVQAAINELELALGSAAEFSNLMASTYSSTLDGFKALIHDECCDQGMLDSLLEGAE